VCPYNAPQLDTAAGHVSKCNMCVDRLEVGLKPACASACLAGALDFGVMETTPEHRDQLETRIPGFPTPGITHPNIRFQQTRSLPREMKRTDSMPLRYERDAQQQGSTYRPRVDESGVGRSWNLKKLRTREDPLVIFTLISQAVIGAFITLFVSPLLGLETLGMATHPVALPLLLFGLIGIQTLALVLSTLHLGKPHLFYRAFNNLRYSPVSREVAGIAVFYNFLGAYTLLIGLPILFVWLPAGLTAGLIQLCGWGAVISGIAALYFMHSIYRIPARPFWNHWQVLTSFYGSMLTLGPLLVVLTFIAAQMLQGQPWAGTVKGFAWLMLSGLALEGVGLIYHARDLRRDGGEGMASHYEQCTRFGNTYLLRNTGMGLSMLLLVMIGLLHLEGGAALFLWSISAMIIAGTALIGRALFYALVIPTTMPGAFFWRNKGFEEHARETGLAEMPQVGVLPECH